MLSSVQNYFYIGLVDLGVILVSAIIKVSIRLRSERRIKRMAEHRALCRLLRDGTWREMSTAELVEGDIIEVVVGESVPVDAVLVTGDVVVDEKHGFWSYLTISLPTHSPSRPIRKFSVKPLTPTDEPSSHLAKTHTLFAGTAVSQTMPAPDSADGRVRALVLRTGTRTERGALVTRILFPSPVAFVFDEQLRVAFLMLAAEAVVM
ncbi:hypothetical protein BC938DRAFT_481504 [Jimgerdemannia flammicorona]|uniref:P-type ATPase A domain-containing protein n=1 Tax=Jimgerdemannia flammicorona TaxID=994334 RepID=A0A433QGP3_9FUNG|nr:hypothetical protein BC938DRAFT_481504 [Jimgerdemannia flammicorona]